MIQYFRCWTRFVQGRPGHLLIFCTSKHNEQSVLVCFCNYCTQVMTLVNLLNPGSKIFYSNLLSIAVNVSQTDFPCCEVKVASKLLAFSVQSSFKTCSYCHCLQSLIHNAEVSSVAALSLRIWTYILCYFDTHPLTATPHSSLCLPFFSKHESHPSWMILEENKVPPSSL